MTTRIDHTICTDAGLHSPTPAGRAWCRKNSIVREWWIISNTEAAKTIGSSEFHYVGSAEENADDTMVENRGENGILTPEWCQIAYSSYWSLKDSNFYADMD